MSGLPQVKDSESRCLQVIQTPALIRNHGRDTGRQGFADDHAKWLLKRRVQQKIDASEKIMSFYPTSQLCSIGKTLHEPRG
jgi:hypothetical protein